MGHGAGRRRRILRESAAWLADEPAALGQGRPTADLALDATLERLRVDRQLEEALTHGPDPLHLAEVSGLDEKTAMRYADSARTPLEPAAERARESRQ